MTSLGGAAATSKPVIRGQFGQRLLVLVDRVRHEGQKWGVDHAPEVDSFGADQITVIRGAAGVRYGADAIGGVILVDPEPMLEQPGTRATVHSVLASNGQRASLAGRVDTMPVERLSIRLSANGTSSADLSAPDYVLANTASRELNLGAAVGYQTDTVHARVSWDRYDLLNGVFLGVRSENPRDFAANLERPPAGSALYTRSRGIERPRQRVIHDRVIARIGIDTATSGHVDVTASYQHNHRLEEDLTRSSITEPQYDFTLRTTALDTAWSHEPVAIGVDANLEGSVGVTGQFQENVYRGLALVPNHRTISGSAYAWERLWRRRSAIEVGARVDRTQRSAFLSDDAVNRFNRRDIDTPCDEGSDVVRCATGWTAATFTVGGLWGTADDVFDIKVDLSSAARTPTIDEQYISGSAPTFPAFALGQPTLGQETTWGASATSHIHTRHVHGEMSPYVSYVDDYIQFAPDVSASGEPGFEVLTRGTFPRYRFSPVDAVWYGIDGSVTVAPDAPLSLDLRGSIVRGQQSDGTPLAFVPPDRLGTSLTAHGPDRGTVESPFVALDVDAVRRQDRVPPGDFAPAPDGYVLFGMRAGTDVRVGSNTVRLSGELRNLADTRYRTYTSLLRYYADEPGRDAIVRASFHSNF